MPIDSSKWNNLKVESSDEEEEEEDQKEPSDEEERKRERPCPQLFLSPCSICKRIFLRSIFCTQREEQLYCSKECQEKGRKPYCFPCDEIPSCQTEASKLFDVLLDHHKLSVELAMSYGVLQASTYPLVDAIGWAMLQPKKVRGPRFLRFQFEDVDHCRATRIHLQGNLEGALEGTDSSPCDLPGQYSSFDDLIDPENEESDCTGFDFDAQAQERIVIIVNFRSEDSLWWTTIPLAQTEEQPIICGAPEFAEDLDLLKAVNEVFERLEDYGSVMFSSGLIGWCIGV